MGRYTAQFEPLLHGVYNTRWAAALALALAATTAAQAQTRAPAAPVRATGDRPSPTGKEITIGRYTLVPRAEGGYEARTEAFIATIAPDGAVAFRDPFRLPGMAVVPVLIGAGLLKSAIESKVKAKDGSSHPSKQPTQPIGAISDEDFRKDVHHAAKMTFLDTTAAFRDGLRDANDQAGLRAFAKRVDAAASDRRRAPVQRRRDLFDLWLDCDDAARGNGARAVVIEAARQAFPAGAPHAYPAAELAALNREAPRGLRFDPYAPAAPNTGAK